MSFTGFTPPPPQPIFTTAAPTYVPPVYTAVLDAASGKDILYGIYSCNSMVNYDFVFYRVAVDGTVLEDITPYVGSSDVNGQTANQFASLSINDPAVTFDATAELPESIAFALLGRRLTWGSDIVAVFMLIRTSDYQNDQWFGFPVGHYVVTSPGDSDLNDPDLVPVTGYSKNYLLQGQPADSYGFGVGRLVSEAVKQMFVSAGLLPDMTHLLQEIMTIPADWHVKQFAQPYTVALGDGRTHIDIVNDMLSQSGCNPLFLTPTGMWTVLDALDPQTQAIQWRWSGDDDPNGFADPGFPQNSVVLDSNQSYNADVFGAYNQFIFVQDGLTFPPEEGSGQYTVDNLTRGPAAQSVIGRVITQVITLQATGQDDLVTQGNTYVTQQFSGAEKIEFQTEAWPIGWYYDVFQFSSESLPNSPTRRVVGQQWILDLSGNNPMQWTTFVVEL